jgi:hypothetical protein
MRATLADRARDVVGIHMDGNDTWPLSPAALTAVSGGAALGRVAESATNPGVSSESSSVS